MGCGVSNSVPCATVNTVPYKRLKRQIDDVSDNDVWRPTVNKSLLIMVKVSVKYGKGYTCIGYRNSVVYLPIIYQSVYNIYY